MAATILHVERDVYKRQVNNLFELWDKTMVVYLGIYISLQATWLRPVSFLNCSQIFVNCIINKLIIRIILSAH